MARGDRFVALGYAQARSSWFRDVARWSTSSAIPLEFLKCVTAEEVRARLRTGRPFSALLVDASAPGVDRDLVDEARSCACAVIVVDDGRVTRDWSALGASAVVPATFDRDDLLSVLDAHTSRIGAPTAHAVVDSCAPSATPPGALVAVTGPGGTGASVVAMALAQGLAAGTGDRGRGRGVLLADLALDADHAMLHDVGDVVPGVQELVEAHRNGRPSSTDVRALAYAVPARGYDVLLGLRRHRDWVTIRPRAFATALDGLRHAYDVVVAEVTGDVEGERQCGSFDVEERNTMARTTVAEADVVLVVGRPGPHGVHALVELVAALADHGVEGARIVPVVNAAPRNPRSRAELARAVAELTSFAATATTVFVPERRRLDDLIHAVAPMPSALVQSVHGAVHTLLDRRAVATVVGASAGEPSPVPVAPGSLGSWYEDDGT